MYPSIKKAKLIHGANILLRDASVEDAEFILSLRLDPQKSKHLSATSSKLDDQISWLRAYETKDNQSYFVICDKSMNRLGCVRIYDPIEFSYCWGSWLMIGGLSPLISIESALLVYAYGKYLGFKDARIDVRKENKYVWNFHEKFFSAERVGESEIDYFYVVKQDVIDGSVKKFSKLITNPLRVTH
jgi:hypothetical protein